MTLALALILDALMGEPDWLWRRLPHPAVLMGRAVGALDQRPNNRTRIRGVLAVALLVAGAGVLGWALSLLGPVAEVIVAAILIAQRSLTQHMRAVAEALAHGLPEARRAVGMIVGRDTADMDEPAIARAAIESGAENFSDGIVAPAFWFAVAGLPGILIYKVVNTADSMIGYRTPRHEAFGWAAARLDDLLNLIPARLSALLIAPPLPGGLRAFLADAHLHRSPNAGWPEAAMARALGVALSGPRSYEGELRDFPWVYAAGDRLPGAPAIEAAIRRLWRAWAIGLAFVIACTILLSAS